MASAALAELRKAARLEGAAIIDMARPDAASVLLFDAEPGVPDAIGNAHQMLRRSPNAPSFMVASDKRPILVSPWILHPERRGGLALWRTAGAKGRKLSRFLTLRFNCFCTTGERASARIERAPRALGPNSIRP